MMSRVSNAAPWQPLATDEAIREFQAIVYDFHDGCLREAHLAFGTHLTDDDVTRIDSARALTVHLLIQLPARLFPRPRAVALRFEQAVGCFFDACPPDCDPTIVRASIERRGDLYYWCVGEQDIGGTGSPWVGGRRLSWRAQDSWTGDTPRYGPITPEA
jgi:hypothetical protein